MRKTENRCRRMDEKPYFSGTNNGPVQKIYLAACAAAQLEVLLLNGMTEECCFSPHIAPDPSKHVFLLLPVGLYCFFSKKWCCSETHCLSQEAVDGGSVAAQVAHNDCRRYPSFYQAISLTF
jgi:hypothetical protein